MKLYTSYFGLFRKLPVDAIPISIALHPPDWYFGRRCYYKLAPTEIMLREWHALHDKDRYIQEYNEQILKSLSQVSVVNDLLLLVQGSTDDEFVENESYKDRDIILLCYEAPGEFCHRHIVAQWLTSAGYICEEYSKVMLSPEKKSRSNILF